MTKNTAKFFSPTRPKQLKYIYASFLTFFFFIIIYSLQKGDGHYIFGTIKFIIFITLFYLFFNEINMRMAIFIGLGIAMVLHSMGRFGYFNKTLAGIPWDVLTHFISSFFTALALFKLLEKSNLTNGRQIFFVLLAGIGLATIGEFLEFFGATQTPHGQGLLGTEAKGSPVAWLSPDYWDTMKDLLMNALGCTTGIISRYAHKKIIEKLF
jgi:uncharacterized membrane protein YjdF